MNTGFSTGTTLLVRERFTMAVNRDVIPECRTLDKKTSEVWKAGTVVVVYAIMSGVVVCRPIVPVTWSDKKRILDIESLRPLTDAERKKIVHG